MQRFTKSGVTFEVDVLTEAESEGFLNLYVKGDRHVGPHLIEVSVDAAEVIDQVHDALWEVAQFERPGGGIYRDEAADEIGLFLVEHFG
jgi:hypothetical protein